MLLGLIYSIGIIENLKTFMSAYLIFLGVFTAVGGLFYLFEPDAAHSVLQKDNEKLKRFYDFQLTPAYLSTGVYTILRKTKWLTISSIVLLTVIPSSKVMYTMMGIYLGQELVQTTEVNSILTKSVQLLEQKIDEELKESSESKNKK